MSLWEDDNTAMVALEGLRPGGEYAGWQGPMDIAIGAIGPGETWEEAARGAYDARWRASLSNLQEYRRGLPGTTYIRFAHEMNGDWYPWSVDVDNYRAFIEAWRRFRAMQQEIFPSSQMVFSANREAVGTGMDWRQMFPGAQYVDVMGVDYYNQWPCVETQEEWNYAVVEKDEYGAPRGIEPHRQFARSVGLPLAVPEWGCNADQCDSPVYIENMYDYFRAHAGSGPGELLYESLFNVDFGGDRWRLYGSDRMPLAAARYRELF
ncbi:glycosyl hydrolase [Geodermatophilus normandii]|uniref:glycosyl hydrolase n=1 Tax=Geodermatophilus normandii TaxID=1137989 RepID=UPI0013D40959